jgi:S1-C subfamily serine protease
MRYYLITSLAFIGVLAGLGRAADNALPVKTLTDMKDATVFIRVEKDKIAAASGSGFLVRIDGESGYIVTNHHVVHLTAKIERPVPYLGRMQPIQPRIRPGLPPVPTPIFPGIEYRTEVVEVAIPAPNITLVFGSGTRNERSVSAEVVAADADADLAVLKVTSLKDLPKPINLKSPELRETMSVFVFGFPFGKNLSVDKGNPAITVGKGSISSIRTDKIGDVKVIQIDGDVNPGNSGGPVVDENGQLVGVVVATVRNTNIGMAISTSELHRMLAGRVTAPKLTPVKADKGTIDVQVEVGLVDPLEQIKSVTLHYAPANAVTETAKKDGLAKLPESKTVELKRDKLKAVGSFSVQVPEKAAFDLSCQVVYVKSDGKIVLSALTPNAINAPAPVADVTRPNPPNTIVTPSVPKPDEKFDAAALAIVLKPSSPGDRGPLVGVTLAPLPKGKQLKAEELALIIAELQVPEKARGAIRRLQNTDPDPKLHAEMARLLEKGAASKSWGVFARMDAASVLRRWGTPETIEALIPLVTDPDVHALHYRHPAMWTMAYLGGGAKAIEVIGARMEVFIDRRGVVQILQQMGSVTEPKALTFLEDKRPEIRVEATKILQSVGTKDSAPALFKATEQDQNEGVRQGARDALRAIAARQEKK